MEQAGRRRDVRQRRLATPQHRRPIMKWLRTLAAALLFLGGAHGALADGFVYAPFKFLDGPRFTVDVAMDGSTWRFDDGSNPFYPTFTGALARGKTFIVSG